MEPIVQEHPSGCAVACVASVLGMSYRSALKRFAHPEHAVERGYYCPAICKALGSDYTWKKYSEKHKGLLRTPGTIVFVRKNEKYPLGHFLARAERGWMNPWINFPSIAPAKAGVSQRLPGKAEWIIYLK